MPDTAPPTDPSAARFSEKPARRRLARSCLALALLGWLISAIAWLLPFHINAGSGLFYETLATIAFFTRVYLIPMAIGWAGLAVLAFVCRRWLLGMECLLSAAAWAAPEVAMALPPAATPVAGDTFAVVSMNLNKDMRDATWAAKVLRTMDADVVSLQELSPEASADLERILADVYPHRLLYPDTGFDGMGVLSKTPLSLRHAPVFRVDRTLGVGLTLNGREVLLDAIHLAPPQWATSRRVNRMEVGHNFRQYARETKPVLLAGDFNFPAMTANAFALRRGGFNDGQLQAGGGRNYTWPANSANGWLPKVRIDTVYAKGPLRAIRSESGPDIGSDHLPIKMTWQWTE